MRAAPPRPIRSLREEVYERLRTLLNRGRLRPGKYLDLNALARQIGISRTPLRDALLRLELRGSARSGGRRGLLVPTLLLRIVNGRLPLGRRTLRLRRFGVGAGHRAGKLRVVKHRGNRAPPVGVEKRS